jgi:hypothetical protein
MMSNMWDCGMSGWLGMALMSGTGFLLFLVLLLAILALAQFVHIGSRHAGDR